ncbi:hypothetical protein CVT91_08115 [Candidatus Atribacteria bacterium HGW-Atribacteria-1]|nr:MAG: hypothetical protein CVT91_08115 [Candidatus Atribacteria bacterium HGW-Atribacteria-1]
MMEILLIILYIIFGISIFGLFWTYAGYPIFIWFLSKIIKKEHKYDENYQPNVSIIIACYNEEKVIGEKLKNILELNYPMEKMQVLVVDSASTDNTRDIVRKYNDKCIELVEQDERKGKAAGLNYALNYAKNDIIVITDANLYMDTNAIKNMAKHFSDPKVGVVGCRYFVKKRKSVAETEGTAFFRKYEEFLREKEATVDSSVNFGSDIYGLRRTLCSFDEKCTLAEDFDVCIRARKRGYMLIHETSAIGYEYTTPVMKEVINQRKRVMTGAIQVLLKHKSMLFNPRYGFYGVLILPGHRLVQIMNPFFLIGMFFSSIGILVLEYNTLIFYLIIIQILGILSAILSLLILKLKPDLKILPLQGAKYFVLVQYSCLLAYLNYFKIRKMEKMNWEKIWGEKQSRTV